MISEPFRKLLSAAVYNPHAVEKRMKELELHLVSQHEKGTDDSLLPFIAALEVEIERFERHQADKAQDPNGPTRETVRHLRDDPVVMLLKRGTINKEDEKTIQEVRELRGKLTQGLTPGGGGQGEKVDTSARTFTHPIERLNARQDKLYVHVYKPWADAVSKDGIRLGERGRELDLNPFNLVVNVIEDGIPLRRLETQHKVTTGALSQPFVSAVRDFAHRLKIAEDEGKVPRGRG